MPGISIHGGSLFQTPGGPVGKSIGNLGWKDMEYGGKGQLRTPDFDAVLKDGAVYQARIRVYDERSGILVREAWSDRAGQWLIDYIRTDIAYLVICIDHTLQYDPIAYSHVFAEVMT